MKGIRFIAPVLAPLALAVSGTASADGYTSSMRQDFIVRVGGSYMSPRSDRVSFVDDTFYYGDAFRSTVDPDAEWGWLINAEWKPVDHWGFELSYTAGDTHSGGNSEGFFTIFLPDGEYDGEFGNEFGDLARYEADVSTASLKFYPMDPTCMVQPYVGGGISYTDFSSSDFRGAARTDLENLGLRGDFDIGYSWGYTWQAGVDFNFGHDSSWLVNVAAVYARSVSDMRFRLLYDDAPSNPDPDYIFESYSGDYIYDPWMFNLSVGYKFSF
jgi:outer membrane protein